MWVFSIAHQHTMLLVWAKRLHKPTLISRVSFYHVSAALLRPEDSSSNQVVKRRRRVSVNASGVQLKPDASDGWQKHKRAVTQKPIQRSWVDSRMSSELKRLSLEDFPADTKEWLVGEKKNSLVGQKKNSLVGQKKNSLVGQKTRSTPDSKAEKYEVVFGIAPCVLALTQGRRNARKLFVKDGEASHRASVLNVCEEAHQRGVQIQRVSKNDLDKMSSGRVHQGVCLQASPLGYLTEDRDSAPKREDTPLWLVLERIQDPMNLGAILRSAYFLGVDRVVSSLHDSCPLSPVVSKASSGVMEVIGVYGYENLEDMLKMKVAQGWQVVGTVGAEAEESQIPVTQCADFQITKPTLLLMGGEGEGLSQQLLSLCQTLLTIPAGRKMFPGIESLNVSVASGILLYSLLSSRRSTR
ncbi:rRNA methyltransferase 1, mitochondrial [Cottoperca gobio]|uniref:rRNA methyltransferase 1, mitochondrial n=1 Tax=Cottoperca gobio TaxID=56716 RepID=A0A6J2RN06_COTGO|nr:rRNA methyltransferase 1, mitochondrial [Cottoperca gobio]